MISAFVPIVALLCLGVILARLRVLPEQAPEVLNQLVIRVCLPAAILQHVPALFAGTSDSFPLFVAVVPWALALVGALLVRLAARLFSWTDGQTRALMLTVALGNTSFLGYPVVEAVMGEDALGTAVIFDQLGSFLILATFGTALAEVKEPSGPAKLVRSLVSFPPFVALLVALIAGVLGLEPPAPVRASIELVSSLMLPLVLVALGLGLRLELGREDRAPLTLGLTLKLAVLPALVLVALRAWGQEGEAARVVLLESAMPPMVTAAVLARANGHAPELATAMASVGVVLSMATLPVVAWLAETLL